MLKLKKRLILGAGTAAAALLLSACASDAGAADYVPTPVVEAEEVVDDIVEADVEEITAPEYDGGLVYLGNGFYKEEIPLLTIFETPVELANLNTEQNGHITPSGHLINALEAQQFDRQPETLDLTMWSPLPMRTITSRFGFTFVDQAGLHDGENGILARQEWWSCTADGSVREGHGELGANAILVEVLSVEAFLERNPNGWADDDDEFFCHISQPIEFDFDAYHWEVVAIRNGEYLDLQIYSATPITITSAEVVERSIFTVLHLEIEPNVAGSRTGNFAIRISSEIEGGTLGIDSIQVGTLLGSVSGPGFMDIFNWLPRWNAEEVSEFFDQFRAISPVAPFEGW